MNYRILALDVDGTLVGTDNVVSGEIAEAVRRAEGAGLGVCLATGRSYSETVDIWRQLALGGPYQPMILIGGALVSEPDTQRTLYHKPMDGETACEFADALGDAGYSAMAIVDAWRHDVEYYMTEHGDTSAAQEQWFARMDVNVRRIGRLAEVLSGPNAPDVLRISAVVGDHDGPQLAAELRRKLDGAVNICPILAPNYGVRIVEAHAAGADKRTALQYVAQATRTPMGAVVAVGDDVNDISMLSSAGLGVAMPQAPDEVLEAADHVATGGLAEFIRQLIDGQFD